MSILYLLSNFLNLEGFIVARDPSIEHSENKIITMFGLFENEVEPGVLQLTVQNNTYAARKAKAQGVGH